MFYYVDLRKQNHDMELPPGKEQIDAENNSGAFE